MYLWGGRKGEKTGKMHQKDPVTCYRLALHLFHKHNWCLADTGHAEEDLREVTSWEETETELGSCHPAY